MARDRHGDGLKPKLLLLDEPTAGMSPEETHETGKMVHALQTEGMTVLAVEHDMAFVRQIATRVTVLHFGRIFAQGSIDEIMANDRVAEIYLGQGMERLTMPDRRYLTVERLRSGYGGKPVLQGVNLTVRDREITAVIGRNGVGKSTLMKTVIGLLPTTDGAIRFNGDEIGGETPHVRARRGIGYVPQGRDVFPRMTVEENLLVGLSISGHRTDDFEPVYRYFPILKERRRQAAGTLSGGQQQQLAIGRVLVGKPILLLLDEPSEGIQPSIVQDIARIVIELNWKTGLTVVLVEQNIDMIRAMAQRCYVMDKGRIVAELTPAMLDDHDIVRRYLAV